MTGFFRKRAVSQIDELLINGKRYNEEQIKDLLKRFGHEILPTTTKKKKG